MKPPIGTCPAARIVVFLVLLSVVPGTSVFGQPFTWGESYLELPCRLPRGDWPPVIQFTGLSVYANATLEEIESTFPDDWMGKPRQLVGLGLRPPGLRLTLDQPSKVLYFNLWAMPFERIVFNPVPAVGHNLDSVIVTWHPQEGSEFFGQTYFGSGGCGFFEIWIEDEVVVIGEATVNLVAIYSASGDTVEVWGSDVGIPDIVLRDTRRSIPVVVEPTTWGSIKTRWR